MKRRKAEKLMHKYLENLHTVLWQEWDISKPERREMAVKWFVDTAIAAGIVEFKDPHDSGPSIDPPQGEDDGFVSHPKPLKPWVEKSIASRKTFSNGDK